MNGRHTRTRGDSRFGSGREQGGCRGDGAIEEEERFLAALGMTNVYNTLKKHCIGLDGADREIDYVVDLEDFFLQEGFAVFDVD